MRYGKTYYTARGIKNFIRKFCAIILMIVVIELSILLLRDLNVKTAIAKWGSIEKGYWTEALFLRDETVILAPLSGQLIPQVASGTRVPRGELLSYINVQSQPVNISELNISNQMELESFRREEQAFRSDLERIKSEIKEVSKKVSKKASLSFKKLQSGPAADLAALEKEKTRIIELQNAAYTKLIELQHKIHDQLPPQALVMAPQPGYIFYQDDGWEGKMTPANFAGIQEGDLSRDYDLKTTGKKVRTGEIIGKIIHPFQQIIMIGMDPNKIELPGLGDSWWYKTGDGLQPVNVAGINRLPGNKVLLALEDLNFNSEFLPNRRSKIFIIYRKTSGVMVPYRSIIRKHHLAQVKVLKGDGFELKKVQIVENDEHNAIINGLEFGTTIISR